MYVYMYIYIYVCMYVYVYTCIDNISAFSHELSQATGNYYYNHYMCY